MITESSQEIFLRFQSDIESKNSFFTDENGLTIKSHFYNEFASFASNLFPVTSFIGI
jgi:hypothetical protein